MPELAAPDIVRVIPDGTALAESDVRRLAEGSAYPAYRHWRRFGLEAPQRWLAWQLAHSHEDPGRHWRLLLQQSDTLGLAWVVSRPWESEQLGVAVANLRHLIVLAEDASARQRITEELLGAAVEAVRGDVSCLTHRVDIDDWATIAALQRQGFHLRDTLVSFLCHGARTLNRLIQRFRPRALVRPMLPEEGPAVEAVAAACAFGGHWARDARLSRADVAALHRAWARECCRKAFADEVIVALREGRVVGFLAYQVQRQLQAALGVRLAGQGLLGVLPAHRGIGLDLIRGALASGCAVADFGQFDVHLDNLEHLRLYAGTLRMAVAHVHHVFHRWLEEPPNTSRMVAS